MTARDPQLRGEREDDLRSLVEAAGRRPAVPEQALRSIRSAVRAEWERLPKSPLAPAHSLRRWVPALLAASLLVSLAVGWPWRRERSGELGPLVPIASIERLRGEVSVVPAGPPSAGYLLPVIGGGLGAGTRVATAAGEPAARLALRLAGGGSLRLDRGTSVRLFSGTRIELERGAVYFDSRRSGEVRASIEIATPLGVVSELGTQFEVRLGTESRPELAVRVREGSVALGLRSGTQTVAAGERLLAGATGVLERRPSERHGADWDWILDAAPLPELEGRSLRSFLDWACREIGWELRFDGPALERDAETIRLHGTLEGLRPDQAIDASLAGAGLGRRIEGGVLTVTRLAPEPGG